MTTHTQAALDEAEAVVQSLCTHDQSVLFIADKLAAVRAESAGLVEAAGNVLPYLLTMLVDDDPDGESIGWEADEIGGHSKPIDFTMGQIRALRNALAKATKP